MRENSAEEETLQTAHFSSRNGNTLLQLIQTFPSTQEFSRAGICKVRFDLIWFIFFFLPNRTNNPKRGQKAETLCGKEIQHGKGNFMIKTPWKIVASETDHCCSGGSKNFNFALAIAPIRSHSPISTCDTPHTQPQASLATKFEKLEEVFLTNFFWPGKRVPAQVLQLILVF